MILPMMAFLFALITMGFLACLFAVSYLPVARLAGYIGFPALFAGLGRLSLSFGLLLLGEQLFGRASFASGAGFLGGYVLGLLGGAVAGLLMAVRQSR